MTDTNAPALTPIDLESAIKAEFYFTAKDGVAGESLLGTHPASWTNLDQITFCVLVLDNGTRVVGVNYGAVSRADFCQLKAREYARGNAVQQLWPLLGFRLRDQVAAAAGSGQ